MSVAQIATLRRIPFVPCISLQHAVLPDDSIQPPNAKLFAKLGSEAAGGSRHAKAGGGSKKGKRGKAGGAGRSGGGDGGWSLLNDDWQAAEDVLWEEADGALLVSDASGSSSARDNMRTQQLRGMATLASWCASLPPSRRSELSMEAGPVRMAATASGPASSAAGIVQWACLGDGHVCLEADAWLGWTQRLILPRCANQAPASVIHTVGIHHPLPAVVACRHLARVMSEWKARPSWRAALGTDVLQGFSLLCLSHAASQLDAEAGIVSGGTPAPSLARLSAEVGSRPEVRRALASAPYIVADDGAMLSGRHVCVDLFADLSAHSRAIPAYLQPLASVLVEVGGALTSAALAAPEVVVSAPNPFESLFPKLMVQFDDPTFADVLFEFAGGETVHAHKLILALSSPTFAAMFGGSMAEGQGGRHTIKMGEGLCPFGADAFRLALLYIYTGELPAADAPHDAQRRESSAVGGSKTATRTSRAEPTPLRPTTNGVARLLELLMAADYLQLEHLKQLGERMMIDWEVLQVRARVNPRSYCSSLRLGCCVPRILSSPGLPTCCLVACAG